MRFLSVRVFPARDALTEPPADALGVMPSTNVRVFVGVCLAVVYVVGTMLAGVVEGISSWDVLPAKEYVFGAPGGPKASGGRRWRRRRSS